MPWWLLVLVVFAAPLADSVVPVLPGEIVVAGAATSLAGGSLPVVAVIAVAAAGSLVGECVVLNLSRRFASTDRGDRWASGPKVTRVRGWLERWGLGAVVVARFVPAGRTATAAGFGLQPGSTSRFVMAAGVGSLLWAGYLVAVGHSLTALF